MSDIIAGLAATIAVVSLVVSFLSWRSAQAQAKASIYAERFAVFTMTQEFLKPWFRDGRPDLAQLYLIVDAWQRSKFLFEPSVTKFLRQLWRDAVKAEYDWRIIGGELEGDRQKAIEFDQAVKLKYLAGNADEPDALYEAFKEMKVP